MADYPLTDAIGWALVHFTWQGALIGAVTAVALMLLRGAAATVRYAVTCGALALMLAAPLVTAQRMSTVPASTDFIVLPGDASMPDVAVPPASRPLPLSGVVSTMPERGIDAFLPVAVYAWIAGVLFLSLRLAGGWVTIAGLRRRRTTAVGVEVQRRVADLSSRLRLSRPVRVMESALVSVPTLVGWLRPVILLPASVVAGLPAAHLDAVLAHELAHVRRHDYLVNALQAVVETLLFYHPVVWWCSRQVRIEREHCCDDLAVAACGDRVVYATALATLEGLRQADMPLALAATGGRLIDRVRRVLGVTPAHDGRARVWAAAVGLMLIVMLGVSSKTLGRADAAGDVFAEQPGAAGDTTEPDLIGPQLKSGNLFTFAWDAMTGWSRPEPLRPPRPPRPPRPLRPPRPPQFYAAPWFQAPAAPSLPSLPALPALPELPELPTLPSRAYVENTITQSDRWGTVRITHRGTIALSDDDTDIMAMSPGAYFSVTESAWWVPDLLRDWVGVRREIVIRGRADGTTARAYYSGERRQAFDPRGRAWLRQLLPEMARHGFGAEARVTRILKRDGVAGVAAEIPRLQGDYLRTLYVRHVLRQAAVLTATDLGAILQAVRHIRSDYEQAQTLIAIARTQRIDATTAPAFFRAADTIQSDYEQRRVLSAASASISDPVVVGEMLRSASGLGSDYEQAEFLRMAVSRQLATQALDAFFHAVNTIDSDYEQRRVLLALLDQPLEAAAAETMLRSASRLGSGYERAEFLIAAARRGLDQQAPQTFFQALDGVGSDHEQRRVLATIAARPVLTDASLAAMIDRALTLRNDFDRAEYLIALARRHRIQGPLRDAYIRAAETMRSDHEQSRALVELLRTERASR